MPIRSTPRAAPALLALAAVAAGAAAGDPGGGGDPPDGGTPAWLTRDTLLSWPGGDGGGGERAENRPNFTENASAVGRGAAVLELGYAYIRENDVDPASIHSFGEPLLRFGAAADWLEYRVETTYVVEDEAGGPTADGAKDLYLGVKVALTPQSGVLPKSAIIPQMLVPTGADEFSAGEVLGGAALVYGWQVTEDLSVAGGTQVNRARNGASPAAVTGIGVNPDVQPGGRAGTGAFTEWAQSVTVGAALTDRAGVFGEYVGFFPAGAGLSDQHYLLGGGTYRPTDAVKLGLRYGVGLNDAAADYFVGPTVSIDLR